MLTPMLTNATEQHRNLLIATSAPEIAEAIDEGFHAFTDGERWLLCGQDGRVCSPLCSSEREAWGHLPETFWERWYSTPRD